jgi:signal transduction histidine kinase
MPLGWILTERERTSYQGIAEAASRGIASAAEESLSDHKSAASMLQALTQAQEKGKCAAVYDTAMRLIASTPCPATGHAVTGLISATLVDQQTHSARVDDRLVVTAPVGDIRDAVGVAVLATPLDPLNDRITAIWGWLALICVAGIVAGTFVSIRLAQWVGGPLLAVDEAVQRLGEGALGTRAPTGRGPREVRRLASTFNTMAVRNESLVHGHRTVIADVSHQLRTPLAALRLRLDLLAADATGETLAELTAAQGEIARLSRLVDGLLAVARAESAIPKLVAVRVDQVVAERLAAWEPIAAERRVALAGRCVEGLRAFLGAGDLEQILDNLLANALEAVPEGGQVQIECMLAAPAGGKTVCLRVVDNGPGMSPRARESAFRRFGNSEANGTGLGLAIVHRLITTNGGNVRLEDTEGGGLTVVLELPG